MHTFGTYLFSLSPKSYFACVMMTLRLTLLYLEESNIRIMSPGAKCLGGMLTMALCVGSMHLYTMPHSQLC